MSKLIFEFETEEMKNDFLAWYLDGNGESEYYEYLDLHDKNVYKYSFYTLEDNQIIIYKV